MSSIFLKTIYTRWDVLLLSFLPALINFLILIYIAYKLKKTRVNVYFALFVFMLAFWQIAEGMVRLSQTEAESLQWYKISSLFVLLVILFGNLFVFRFTLLYKKISNGVIFIFYILPIIVFFICVQLNLDTVEILVSKNWYWIANPLSEFVTLTMSLWIAIGSLMMLIPILYYYLKAKKKSIRKKQLMLLAIGLSFPIIIGIAVELIFPLLLNIDNIPIAASLVTFFSITSVIAIGKYKMLDFSPKHHWGDIIKSMQEGILIVDNDNIIMYANKAFSNLVGYLPQELLGINEITLLYNGYPSHPKEEILVQTKDGTRIWVFLSKTPYTDSNGIIIGSIGLYTNINQIKETKQNLKLINNELELYVYKASHDLRGPVTTILGLINIWKMDDNLQSSKNYLGMIEETTKKLDETLTSMIKAMQVKEVNKFEDDIQFASLIDNILGNFINYEGFNNITIIKEINYKGKYLSNKFILETIFLNLIENSIKYQRYDLSDSFLKITVNEISNGKIQLIFEDNGRGINPFIQSKVFDMYYRGNNDSTGSGLGLYLVKKSIEKLQGEILLKSSIDNGTKFTLTLH